MFGYTKNKSKKSVQSVTISNSQVFRREGIEGREGRRQELHADEDKRKAMITDCWGLGIRAHALTTTKPQSHFPHALLLTTPTPPISFYLSTLFNCPNLGRFYSACMSGKTCIKTFLSFFQRLFPTRVFLSAKNRCIYIFTHM